MLTPWEADEARMMSANASTARPEKAGCIRENLIHSYVMSRALSSHEKFHSSSFTYGKLAVRLLKFNLVMTFFYPFEPYVAFQARRQSLRPTVPERFTSTRSMWEVARATDIDTVNNEAIVKV